MYHYSVVTVECPPMGESITEGTFVSILVQPGTSPIVAFCVFSSAFTALNVRNTNKLK
jgi:hypothetical protein